MHDDGSRGATIRSLLIVSELRAMRDVLTRAKNIMHAYPTPNLAAG